MTDADYWLAAGGRWRTARKAFACQGKVRSSDGRLARCATTVAVGERYLDTREHDTNARSPWGTLRYCATCALRPLSEESN